MASKLAKKLDQLYLSRAELRRNRQVNKLQRIVRDCEVHIKAEAEKAFGALFVRRLKRSANRAGRSVVGYSADILVP